MFCSIFKTLFLIQTNKCFWTLMNVALFSSRLIDLFVPSETCDNRRRHLLSSLDSSVLGCLLFRRVIKNRADFMGRLGRVQKILFIIEIKFNFFVSFDGCHPNFFCYLGCSFPLEQFLLMAESSLNFFYNFSLHPIFD